MITILSRRPEPQYKQYRQDDDAYLDLQPNCDLSWVLLHFRIRSGMFGQVRVVRVTHTNSPADRSPARVQRWPSAGTRRGQYAGSALLRNEAMHSVLPGPRAVSCLVFFAQSARSCRFTLGWRRRAAQSENQLDTGRFAMKGMASTRPCQWRGTVEVDEAQL